jgi:hypothetical protein
MNSLLCRSISSRAGRLKPGGAKARGEGREGRVLKTRTHSLSKKQMGRQID